MEKTEKLYQQLSAEERATIMLMRRERCSGSWTFAETLPQHRMVYRIEGNALLIAQFRFHY